MFLKITNFADISKASFTGIQSSLGVDGRNNSCDNIGYSHSLDTLDTGTDQSQLLGHCTGFLARIRDLLKYNCYSNAHKKRDNQNSRNHYKEDDFFLKKEYT